MNLKILYNLFKERKILSPDRDFQADLWKKLSNRWQEVYHVNYYWYQTWVFKVTVASMISLVVVGGFSTGAYAYVSSSVYEGTPLYPVKQILEKMEGLTKITPVAKAEFNLKKISRREAERAKAEEKLGKVSIKLEKIDKRIEEIEEDLVRSETEIVQIKSKDSDLADKVMRRLEERKNRLEDKIEKEEEHKDVAEEKIEKIQDKNSLYIPNVSRDKGRRDEKQRNENKK